MSADSRTSPSCALQEPGPSPLAAPYYADGAVYDQVAVVENVRLARDTYRLRFPAPEIARRIRPGQFLMMRLVSGDDPLLARPFALYDTALDDEGQPTYIDVVYLVVGRMTRRLAMLRPGDAIAVWGPLGNGFATTPTRRLIMVAGGIGQTPFLALGRAALGKKTYGVHAPQRSSAADVSAPLMSTAGASPAGAFAAGASAEGAFAAGASPAFAFAQQATLCYGVRSADLLAGSDDFIGAGIELRVSSDDGTIGRPGWVTDLLVEALDEQPTDQVRVACCGPEPMMEAVARLTAQRNVPCEVSLETPMACGLGICFSCVAQVRDSSGDAWDYKRTCVEGPVFDARRIVWP